MKQLLLVLAIVLSGCSHQSTTCKDYKAGSGPTRIVAFGDSQTTGHGDETSTGCGFSYANALSLDYHSSLINMAVGGTNFVSDEESGWLLKMDFQSTDRIVMFIGFNDMRSAGTDPEHLADFKDSLRSSLQRVSPMVASITIATTLDPIDYGVSGSRAAVEAFREAVHDVVDGLGLSNVSAFDPDPTLDRNPVYFAKDLVHLNRSGQAVLTKQFESTGPWRL